MELSPSWEATYCAATQELPSILWNPKVHYYWQHCKITTHMHPVIGYVVHLGQFERNIILCIIFFLQFIYYVLKHVLLCCRQYDHWQMTCCDVHCAWHGRGTQTGVWCGIRNRLLGHWIAGSCVAAVTSSDLDNVHYISPSNEASVCGLWKYIFWTEGDEWKLGLLVPVCTCVAMYGFIGLQ
jgi:hypothetical protein